jgi:hypothetical protein
MLLASLAQLGCMAWCHVCLNTWGITCGALCCSILTVTGLVGSMHPVFPVTELALLLSVASCITWLGG